MKNRNPLQKALFALFFAAGLESLALADVAPGSFAAVGVGFALAAAALVLAAALIIRMILRKKKGDENHAKNTEKKM